MTVLGVYRQKPETSIIIPLPKNINNRLNKYYSDFPHVEGSSKQELQH